MKEKIIIIGGGGHAKVIISILKKLNKYEIVGYTDIISKENILGFPYLGNDTKLYNYFNNGIKNCVVGIGQIKSAELRKKVVLELKELGFNFPIIISPSAIINEDVKLGEGTVVMDGVIINSGTDIGSFVIINTKSSIDHDCRIGDFVHIAPGSTLSGDVVIMNEVLIGTGACIIQGITIAEKTIVASGSAVHKNITEKGIYIGVPATIIKKRN